MKPSERDPTACMVLVDLLKEAGMPGKVTFEKLIHISIQQTDSAVIFILTYIANIFLNRRCCKRYTWAT